MATGMWGFPAAYDCDSGVIGISVDWARRCFRFADIIVALNDIGLFRSTFDRVGGWRMARGQGDGIVPQRESYGLCA